MDIASRGSVSSLALLSGPSVASGVNTSSYGRYPLYFGKASIKLGNTKGYAIVHGK